MISQIYRRHVVSICLAAALSLSGCGLIVPGSRFDTDTKETSETSHPPDAMPETTASGLPPVSSDKSEYYRGYADAYLKQIADYGYRFDGASFFISTPRSEIVTPAEAEDSYSLEIDERNTRVEDALDVRITSSLVDEPSYYDQLNASLQADEYFSDLLMIPEGKVGQFAVGGLLTNLLSMPMLDLTEPYFSTDSREAATAVSQVYAIAGDASFEVTSLSAVYFNRGLFLENSVAIPFDLVYEGEWTWDAFFASAASVSGINAYCVQNGLETFSSYSVQYAADSLPSIAFASCGESFVRSDGKTSPVIAFDESSPAAAVIEKLYSEPNRHTDISSGVSRFHTGKSLYMIDRLYLMSWMPDSKQNWAILPIPKLRAEQENYITLADESTLFFAVQRNIVDSVRSSIVLAALNAASYGVLNEAYVSYATNSLLRDNDSANMLSIIAHSRSYDFAIAFSATNGSLASATKIGMTDLATGTSFAKICERIPAANRQLADKFPA